MAPKKPKTQSLTQALAQLLSKTLLPDLQARAAEPAIALALTQQYEAEKAAERTAESQREFVARTLEQVAAAWILSCVFVRVLEDRALLAHCRLAGDGARDSEQLFFELAPSLTARDYLLTVFQEVASMPGAAEVLGSAQNPAFRFSPSNEGARALLEFFRECEAQGALRWQFAGQDTRFLGDLYQDLSEDVRKRYALLQTPDFVESFILDQSLTPAIDEFGLEGLRVIDPTCGSGHFLLGAFERLLDARLRNAPGVDIRTHALAALDQVYGVDVNPYAVAVARFRLTLAYLERCGFMRLAQAPKLKLNLVVADSLLHGAADTTLRFTEHDSARGDEQAWGFAIFALDDPAAAQRLFDQRYHVVVGNPPYITCKDAKLRDAHRKLYQSCHREYSLAAPFTERFFGLAVDGGFVGLINANSFMKREFGKALIEKVLKNLDLTRVIDTAGAYIPGHGTPTVLLFGRKRKPSSENVSGVLGKRGEPTTPENAEQGLVWRSIVDHLEEIGFDNDYISVATVPRSTLDKHPWSLGGGGAADLKELLENRAPKTLSEYVDSIGFMAITKQDDVFGQMQGVLRRNDVEQDWVRSFVVGEHVRDWSVQTDEEVLFPYTDDGRLRELLPRSGAARFLWPFRTVLESRAVFGGETFRQSGRAWHAYGQIPRDRIRGTAITFAFVATHNHFVLDRGGKVFNRSAPIIKLPESATEDDHLALLAYLNSSTACFWMKQVLFQKSSQNYVGDVRDKPERIHYEFSGTQLGKLPVPRLGLELARLGREATRAAEERDKQLPANVLPILAGRKPADVARALVEAERSHHASKESLRRIQVEIDWEVYRLFALIEQASPGSALSPSPALQMIERPLFKRPWLGVQGVFHRDEVSYDDLVVAQLQGAVGDLFEHEVGRAQQPLRAMSVATAIAEASVVDLLAQRTKRNSPDGALQIAMSESAPFLSGYMYSATGLKKRVEWIRSWDLQRREDLGERLGAIPVPPKYDVKDFREPNYFRLRGKLDVPKERFISYPGCQKDGDDSPLIGWAGWNHLQRAQALIALYQERKLEDGWPKERLMPMLVGLHELMFWLELWHSEPEAGSANPAREIKQYLDAELSTHRLTVADLEAWKAETKQEANARKRATKKTMEKA